jgi:choline kinase
MASEFRTDAVAVILLAGLGSRLGRPHPKSLTPLPNGETILARQLRILKKHKLQVVAVVGFKMEQIMEAAPDALFAYNPNFDTTNTSKSLLCALQSIHNQDVIWLNGDVVFDEQVISLILDEPSSAVAGDHAQVAEEEVKYQVDENGYVTAISKLITPAVGEAVGINKITADLIPAFREELKAADENDYFERAMETMTEKHGPLFKAIDISKWNCVEVDFAEDLERAEELFK